MDEHCLAELPLHLDAVLIRLGLGLSLARRRLRRLIEAFPDAHRALDEAYPERFALDERVLARRMIDASERVLRRLPDCLVDGTGVPLDPPLVAQVLARTPREVAVRGLQGSRHSLRLPALPEVTFEDGLLRLESLDRLVEVLSIESVGRLEGQEFSLDRTLQNGRGIDPIPVPLQPLEQRIRHVQRQLHRSLLVGCQLSL